MNGVECSKCHKLKNQNEFTFINEAKGYTKNCSACLLKIKKQKKARTQYLQDNDPVYLAELKNREKELQKKKNDKIKKRKETDELFKMEFNLKKRKNYLKTIEARHISTKKYRKTFGGKYARCKENATSRNLEFSISLEKAIELYQSPCYYCNIFDAENICGIDRLNNIIGYTNDNVVSSCLICNKMKLEWDYHSFIAYVGHISQYNGGVGTIISCEKLPVTIRATYNQYKIRATEKNIYFELSRDEFETITANPCYLCGKENSNVHLNGLDRLNNNVGYIINNVKSCCGSCNLMKHTSNLNVFILKCEQIYLHHKNRYVEPEKIFKNRRNLVIV